MLSKEQKAQIEAAAAQQLREEWGGLSATRVRGVIDDVRAKVVEEAWFGKETSSGLNDHYTLNQIPDKASIADLYGWAAEKGQSAWESVFGKTEAEQAAPQPGRYRDGPEIGD